MDLKPDRPFIAVGHCLDHALRVLESVGIVPSRWALLLAYFDTVEISQTPTVVSHSKPVKKSKFEESL